MNVKLTLLLIAVAGLLVGVAIHLAYGPQLQALLPPQLSDLTQRIPDYANYIAEDPTRVVPMVTGMTGVGLVLSKTYSWVLKKQKEEQVAQQLQQQYALQGVQAQLGQKDIEIQNLQSQLTTVASQTPNLQPLHTQITTLTQENQQLRAEYNALQRVTFPSEADMIQRLEKQGYRVSKVVA